LELLIFLWIQGSFTVIIEDLLSVRLAGRCGCGVLTDFALELVTLEERPCVGKLLFWAER
jgi:hypothetical protein